MIDNKKVGASKGGIEAKIQRGKPEKTWQDGSMCNKGAKANWKREGGSLTPRKA